MNTTGGAQGTPKPTKDIKSRADAPILNVNDNSKLDENNKSKNKSKREGFVIKQLERLSKECSKCRGWRSKYTNEEIRSRMTDTIMRHIKQTHKKLDDTIPVNTEENIGTNSAKEITGSTSSLLWESQMDLPLDNITSGTQGGKPSKDCFEARAYNVPTKNVFQPLLSDRDTDVESDMETETIEENRKIQASRTTRPKINKPAETPNRTTKSSNPKPPPLIIAGIISNNTNHRTITTKLNQTLSKGYSIKYTKNNTIINAKDPHEYVLYRDTLKEEKCEFHTYATKEEKTHAFVIKGLDHRPEIEDIKHELKQTYNIDIKQIYLMETRYRPLYLVITSTEYKLNLLKNKIKTLNHTEVTWERRRQSADIIQCRRCSMWGHATSNCFRALKCVRCAGPHKFENTCNEPIKCANCGGPHAASDRNCPVYTYKNDTLKMNQQIMEKPKPRYVEAPRPKNNIWENRAAAMQKQQNNDPREQRQQRQPTTSQRGSNEPDFNNLAAVMTDFNNEINVPELIILLTDITAALRLCTNKTEKFTTILGFISRINNYNI